MSEIFWKNKGWEKSDKHLKDRDSLPFQRKIPFVPSAEGLFIIRGPRQIGKTTWLKEILSQKVRAGENCFYLSCEKVQNSFELAEVLKSCRDCSTVLLDEVNYVEGWDRVVKSEIDGGHTRTIVVTGSHSADLRRGADRLPGRFGNGMEYFLLPMLYDEFVSLRDQAGWNKKSHIENVLDYFKIGGFPFALAEAGPKSDFPKKSLETIKRWITGDFLKLGKQETFLVEILIQLAKTQSSKMSLQTLAKKTSVGSHNTAGVYLAVLEDCFALRTLHAIDPNSGSFKFRSQKKFYFRDPLLFWLALSLDGKNFDEKYFESISEMVAAEHLCRKDERVGFLSTENSGEIDFFRHEEWALEQKWTEIPVNLSRAFLKLNYRNKIVWTKKNYLKDWPNFDR